MYCATLSKGFNIDEYQFKDFYKIECHQHVGCLEKKRPISTLYKSYASKSQLIYFSQWPL